MNLGRCDVCLRVKDTSVTSQFYRDLGFEDVEGDVKDGWIVVSNGDLRLGLFSADYMEEPMSLNFRNGDVLAVVQLLEEKGHAKGLSVKGDPSRGHSVSLRDPDGVVLFLDSAIGQSS